MQIDLLLFLLKLILGSLVFGNLFLISEIIGYLLPIGLISTSGRNSVGLTSCSTTFLQDKDNSHSDGVAERAIKLGYGMNSSP